MRREWEGICDKLGHLEAAISLVTAPFLGLLKCLKLSMSGCYYSPFSYFPTLIYPLKEKVCHTKVVGIRRTFPTIPHMTAFRTVLCWGPHPPMLVVFENLRRGLSRSLNFTYLPDIGDDPH